MSLLRRLGAILALATVLHAPASAFAAPEDAVMNKEGYWGIDVDNGACAASMTLQGGAIFLLRAKDGQATFALFARSALPKGKVVRLETEAYGFDFRATYGEDATSLFYNGDLDAQALAALRLARQVRILADGRQVAAMTFEGTGFPGALDGVTACSKGEKGWWGSGVEHASNGPAPVAAVFNKEGFWSITVGDEPGICVAQAVVGDHRELQILAARGRTGLAVGSIGEKLPRGRKGRVETDAYAFDFKPKYDSAGYMAATQPFDSQALDALAQTKSIRVSVDGRELIDASLEDSGFAELLESVAACSRGKKGWWSGEAPAAP